MKIIKLLLKIFLFSIIILIILHFCAYGYVKMSKKIDLKNANKVLLYDAHNHLFFEGSGKEEWIALNQISPYVIKATIATEDKNFYHHFGFDYLRIIKSIYKNLKAKKIIEGASTITQQYARNIYLNFTKDWKRKLKECWLTFKIEVHYKKDEILEGY